MPGTRADNLVWEGTVERGNVDAAFAREDVIVVEDEYEVPRQHQAYIEPRAATARWEAAMMLVVARIDESGYGESVEHLRQLH